MTAATATADAGIHKKILGSVHDSSSALHNTKLIISNNEMKDIVKIVKYLEDFGLLLKEVTETIQNEAKEQKAGFLSLLLSTLGAILLGNILAGKGMNRAGEGIVRAGYGNKKTRMDIFCRLIFQLILNYKNIIKMNQYLMVFIQEIIYPIK